MPREVKNWMDVHAQVKNALAAGAPVLAFESTLITHGMPRPKNLATALQMEQASRDVGVVPATIAILDGRIKVGLVAEEMERLAKDEADAVKTSRRDLPWVLAAGLCGGTTVAATMIVAAMAGIRVFATGGIGGVHRDAQRSMDISADLEELARTDVAVVCAGPKSILDIGLTLEYLETRGVTVLGYRTHELPAFFTASSGFAVDYRLDSVAQVAAVLNARKSLGLRGGTVIANPIPSAHALHRSTIDAYIDQACAEAKARGIGGKQLTPYLLQRINELSDGASLDANVQLLLSNARLGAEIALALHSAE